VTAVTVSVSTITATINSKVETYTASATDTVTTFATAFVSQLLASLIPEFRLVTWTNPGVGIIQGTGPQDGRPVTITWGGTATASTTTTVAPTSPFDAGDALNYAGGLPVNGDVLVLENNAASLFYNLAALTSITFTIIRRSSHTGTIGLADNNSLGFVEFLPRHLECAGTAITIADNSTGFLRIRSTAATATTLTITGNAGGGLGQEYVEVFGLPASSIININGGTLALAPLGTQSALATTVRVNNGVFRSGPSATLTTLNITNSTVQLNGAYTTFTQDRGSTSTMLEASAGTTTNIEDGTVFWASTGGPGALNINSGGTFDNSGAPGAVAVGTVTLNEGATILDPAERFTKTYNIVIVGELANLTMDLGTTFNLAVS